MKTLRLNMLELMNYSKIRKNKKKFSEPDIYQQIDSIYVISERKPSSVEVLGAMKYLRDRKLIEAHAMGEVTVHNITIKGRELLTLISDGDDTAII